jgi:hypothetical protein
MVAFDVQEGGKDVPPGYQIIGLNIVFDCKMDLTRKWRIVAQGHLTDLPAMLTYASVVSRDSVRIALTIAALNDLEVKASNVQGAYLNAPCREKIAAILGPEFGEHQGKKAIITRALYGLKSSGAAYRAHIADCMRHLGWTLCRADPDVWMKPEICPDDDFKYYAYMLLYVDDCLCIHHDGMREIHRVNKYFPMKKSSMGDLDLYL